MKYLVIIISFFLSFNTFGASQSYLKSDYYQVQDMIWEYGDSITEIDYENRTISFVNRDNILLYTGKIIFNQDWISVKSELHYINYYNGYSVKEYLKTLTGSNKIKIVHHKYYIYDICYRVSMKQGKLFIREI